MNVLEQRHRVVAFWGKSTENSTFARMTNFTEMSPSKNPKEYTRQYIDEAHEQRDVVGYSPSISFAFDSYTDNEVLDDLREILDKNLLGSDAIRDIAIVYLDRPAEGDGVFTAKRFSVSVVGSTEGGDLDRYGYKGTFYAKTAEIWGTAVSSDDWQTCTFTETAA